MANSVDPDQTALIRAVCSGSTLFASILNSSIMLGNYLQQMTSADDISDAFFFLGALQGRVAQSVTCLVTDAKLTADPGVASSILARSHTFVEIGHEIISTVILLSSAESFMKGCCQLQAKVCAQLLVNCLFKLAQEKVWLGELTVPQ